MRAFASPPVVIEAVLLVVSFAGLWTTLTTPPEVVNA
jgi:hypothetical protein